MAIFVGDVGTSLKFIVKDNGKVIPITGASVSVIAKLKKELQFSKNVKITDEEKGECQLDLTAEDISKDGTYIVQATVRFPNGNKFTGLPLKFVVLPLI